MGRPIEKSSPGPVPARADLCRAVAHTNRMRTTGEGFIWLPAPEGGTQSSARSRVADAVGGHREFWPQIDVAKSAGYPTLIYTGTGAPHTQGSLTRVGARARAHALCTRVCSQSPARILPDQGARTVLIVDDDQALRGCDQPAFHHTLISSPWASSIIFMCDSISGDLPQNPSR